MIEPQRCRKERLWRTARERRAGDRHGRGHHAAVEGDEEDLLAVAAPRRLLSARGRDAPGLGRHGKSTHEDLGLARLVRAVRDPVSVSGKVWRALVELGMQDELGFRVAVEILDSD